MAEPEEVHVSATSEPRARPVGGTEYSWCRAVPTGTGITVLSLLLSKLPDVQLLQTALNNLQNSHPILRSKLRFDSSTNSFSFVTPPEPHIQITSFDLSLTSQIIRNKEDAVVTPFHLLLEHEMNQNTWSNLSHQQNTESNLFYLSIYTLSEAQWAVILRLHTSICDRAAAVGLLRELLELMVEKGGGIEREYERIYEVNLGIEDYIPSGKANKPFWARGVDMLGYSLNSFRLANISFLDADSPRYSQVVRLQLNGDETAKLLAVSGFTEFNHDRLFSLSFRVII